MRSLQQQRLESTELVFTEKEHSFLGPELVLQKCHIVLRTNAKALTLTACELIDCKIEAKKKLSNFQMWCGARIKG